MIFRMSAIVGQDWRPKTFRELFIQWQAVLLETWDHTSHMKAALAMQNVKLEDLHPYRRKQNTSSRIRSGSLFRDSLDDDFINAMLNQDKP